jgi:hypothetical protein
MPDPTGIATISQPARVGEAIRIGIAYKKPGGNLYIFRIEICDDGNYEEITRRWESEKARLILRDLGGPARGKRSAAPISATCPLVLQLPPTAIAPRGRDIVRKILYTSSKYAPIMGCKASG